MAGPLRLYNDTQNRNLVKSNTDTTIISFPTLIQGETVTIQAFFLDPTGGTYATPFSYVGLSGATMKLGIIAGNPTSGTDTTIAYQDTWTAISGGFQGSLALNTVGVSNAFTATGQTIACSVEIEVTEQGGTPVKYYQGVNTIKAAIIDSQSSVPVPTASYPTRNEVNAGWLKKVETAGVVWRSLSPNGSWARDLGVNNDGSALDNIIQLM